MNSLLNNLGPRHSRGGGGDIFISISIIISLIVIFYMVYKLIQGNKSEDDDKNNEDDTVLVPEISPPVMGMVLMPDKDNTNTGTEQYEVGDGKLETYKIEYETGTDINTTLSKNVRFSVDWNNTIGFNTVNSITFTHYIKSFEDNAEYVAFKTKVVEKPTPLGTDVISNYFKNNSTGNSFTFDGTKGDFNNGTNDYSVLGYNRIGISINYGDGDGTDIVVYGPGDFNNDEQSSAKVRQDDLTATLKMVKEKLYVFLPEETKDTSIGGKYIKIVYHVFPYNNSGFVNHLSSYLGTINSCGTATTNNTNNMVSLNLIDGNKDTFKIQVFPGDFDTEITNSDNNYLGFCNTDKSIVSGGISKENALSFIMVKPPTDITLPTDTPDKTGTAFLGYKTFKVIDGTKDKFLVISDGLLKLKKWEDLTSDELPTMIMAFYKKDAKGCYVISPENKSEDLRRFINSQCHEIRWANNNYVDHLKDADVPYDGNQIFNTEALCENTAKNTSWKYDMFWVQEYGRKVYRDDNCEWRNPTQLDL